MLASYKRLLDRIGAVELGIGVALIVLIVVAISVQVFTRYALGRPIAWVEESATYAFIWMVFVGASLGLKKGRHIFIATSPIHMEHKLKMTPEEVVARVREMVGYARSLCPDIEFSPEDAGRSDPRFLYRVLAAAIEAGATTLNIPDTVGYTVPVEYGQLIRDIRVRGVMVGVELTCDAAPVVAACLEKNLLINATQGKVIRLLPALNLPDDLFEEGCSILADVLGRMEIPSGSA